MPSNIQLLSVQRSYSLCSFSSIETPFLWKLGIRGVENNAGNLTNRYDPFARQLSLIA